jgi:HPt (histidine-containing phosphotransfer) domain-containing protein
MSAQKQRLSMVLNELKADYLKKLPTKIVNLRALTEAQNWEGLEDEYHKLKGTGKTYGFPEISTICEKLEFLVQQKHHQKPELFQGANDLLEKMHQGYVDQKPVQIHEDPFACTLLALKLK